MTPLRMDAGRAEMLRQAFSDLRYGDRDDIEEILEELAVNEAMDRAGYRPIGTGGNCEAWALDRGDGTQVLICNEESGLYARPEARAWTVGRHSTRGCGSVDVGGAMALDRAIALGGALRAPLTPFEQVTVVL